MRDRPAAPPEGRAVARATLLLLLFLSPLVACGVGPGRTGEGAGPRPGEEAPGPGGEAPGEPVVHTVGVLSGREVFISIGGVRGVGHDAVLDALQRGYARSGFRIHWVVVAMSFDPFEAKMREVADEYDGGDVPLEMVVFHHTGHGWGPRFLYEPPAGERGETFHTEVFRTLGAEFPESEAAFGDTEFGVILDACGQGGAADLRVSGRRGFVATSSPTAANPSTCQANSCEYFCRACIGQAVPTYRYSIVFGRSLPGHEADDFETAHDAAQDDLENNWSCPGDGRWVEYAE